MGKGASRQAQDVLGKSAERSVALSEKLEKESEPARAQARGYFSDIISGDRAKATRALAPQIQNTKDQFSQARKAIERNMPRGGTHEQARADMDQAEAGAIGNLYTGSVNESLARLSALSTFGTQAGIAAGNQGVSAGSALANLAAGQRSGFMGGMGGLASGAGFAAAAFSSMIFKENIELLEDFEGLKRLLLSTPLWKYKWVGDPTEKQCAGVIVEESDPMFRAPDGISIDLQTFLGAVLATLKQQQIEIELLKRTRESNA